MLASQRHASKLKRGAHQANRFEIVIREISANEVRVLNEKYEEVAHHQRAYDLLKEPIIDWLKYLPAITRKPYAFKYTAFFKTLPTIWQEYFNGCDIDEGKKMLNVLAPIIIDGKLEYATEALKHEGVKDSQSFLTNYRRLTEPKEEFASVITRNTPFQTPYKQTLEQYSVLMGGE